MTRALYSLLWNVAAPLLPLRLLWRSRKEPGYRAHMAERFGRYRLAPTPPVIWVHAVSLGETQAARPLVARLRTHLPHATVLLTHMTATGRSAGEALRDERVVQCWLPYDVPRYVRAFLAHFRPVAGLLLETEVWPNLLAEARRQQVPVFLVNARLSARSATGYARFAGLARATFGTLTGIAAQSVEDAARLQALGGPAPIVTGNLKFDVEIDAAARRAGAALRALFGPGRPVWLAASTRDGEEDLILDALARTRLPAQTLLVIVPRHPQRFDAVAAVLRSRGLRFVRRSAGEPIDAAVDVVLGDTMGEMAAYCVAADAVLVGGSLLPFGGQNLIEPIAAGKPTIVGPHMFNFAGARTAAVGAGAALQVRDASAAVEAIGELLRDPRRREAMAGAALDFHAAHRGAADRLWEWLAPALQAAAGGRQSD